MYRKGLLSLVFMATWWLSSPAQTSPSTDPVLTAFDQATAQCHSLADAVDREICLARAAMASADAGVRDLSSSPEQRKRWQSIRDAQQAKIHRLEAMDPEARRQFNELSLRAAEAKAAASSH